MPTLSLLAGSLALAVGLGQPAPAVESRTNVANWKLANRFTSEAMRPYLYSSSISPTWIGKTDLFWYSWRDSKGTKYYKVDPKAKSKTLLFDPNELAAAISATGGRPVDAETLDLQNVSVDEKEHHLVRFRVQNKNWEFNTKTNTLKEREAGAGGTTPPAVGPGGGRQGGGGRGQGGGQGFAGRAGSFKNNSPDNKSYVYAQDHNLFFVQVVDGKEGKPLQITFDGEVDYSFGFRDLEAEREQREQFRQQQQQQGRTTQTEGQGGGTAATETRVRANVTWSKDSKRFYVSRFDSRKVKELYLVNSLSEPRPSLLKYKYAMPGEADVTQQELYTFDTTSRKLTKLPVDKWKDQRLFNVHWQDTTSDSLRFVRRDRLQRNLELCQIDLTTNKIEVMLTEKVENAFLESQNVNYVKPGGDFVWFSERTGWGHYYLYSNDGKLKNAITSGPWRADGIVHVDADKNEMWVNGVGKEAGENPYYKHTYRVSLTGGKPKLLDSGDADHSPNVSPTKQYFVDQYSRVDMAPEMVVRDVDGNVVMPLEKTDLSRLEETGFRMPDRFTVKAADGVTDIYGNMWKPIDFDPKKKYPIIANVYPGPQTESVSSTFSALATNHRLAQLGFIVIQIGNRGGNPARSNAYHSYGYYNLRDYGLADKKAGIEQLALRHPWIDVEKVGIYGHSGGGFMTAAALLLPPFNDFFKCGVSSAGNHDNNIYNQNWSEQHHGLRVAASTPPPASSTGAAGAGATGDGEIPQESYLDAMLYALQFDTGEKKESDKKFEIKVPTNHELAANLKNKLLLVHGDMDNNVHPGGTVRLVNALIRANKRFDMMMLPGKAHGFADMQPYFTQMLMEYFSEHLLGDYYRGSSDMNNTSGK